MSTMSVGPFWTTRATICEGMLHTGGPQHVIVSTKRAATSGRLDASKWQSSPAVSLCTPDQLVPQVMARGANLYNWPQCRIFTKESSRRQMMPLGGSKRTAD